MKNVKDLLYEWRNNFKTTLFCALLLASPIITTFLIIFYNLGSDESNYEIYKWFIFIFIAISIVGHNILIFRCENYEKTIEKMNYEIECLKDEVKSLKKKEKDS